MLPININLFLCTRRHRCFKDKVVSYPFLYSLIFQLGPPVGPAHIM
jgi:hypothetical protein